MRRSTLNLMRCPRCLAGSLVPEAQVAKTALSFGPTMCVGCGARFPVHEGLLDLGVDHEGDRAPLLPAQYLMEQPWLARAWERTVRPALDAVMARRLIDVESEFAVVRNFIGSPAAPLVDLGCGSGAFLRRFAKEFAFLDVIGVDLSKPMLEEAIALVREEGLAADFVRAQVPLLPFVDRSLGCVSATGFIHFVPDFDVLAREAARVLKPRGRLVVSTFKRAALWKHAHQRAGLYPRDEHELKAITQAAGFIRFERVQLGPFITCKVELP
jgi:SAM-dependent methyltransferase